MYWLKGYAHFKKLLILIASLYLFLHDHFSVFRLILGILVFRILASLLNEKCCFIALIYITLINNEVELFMFIVHFSSNFLKCP